MILYGCILLAAAMLMGGIGIAVCRGHTALIHQYHQERVKDAKAYGRAIGKALLLLAVTLTAAAVLGFANAVVPSLIVLFAGMTAGLVALIVVQTKYNGGVF